MENEELQKFYIDFQEEINSSLISEEEGTNPEQIFTELALSDLSEAGETENYRVCFDEKISKRGVEHKINGYSLYENYETLDLFVTIYNGDSTIQSVLDLCRTIIATVSRRNRYVCGTCIIVFGPR